MPDLVWSGELSRLALGWETSGEDQVLSALKKKKKKKKRNRQRECPMIQVAGKPDAEGPGPGCRRQGGTPGR